MATFFKKQPKVQPEARTEKQPKVQPEMKTEKKKWRPPVLKAGSRILLYAATLALAVLSVWQVIGGYLPDPVGTLLYVCTASSLFAACLYLAGDIRKLTDFLAEMLRRMEERYRYLQLFLRDDRFRTFVFAFGGLLSNVAFALFNGAIGVISRSPWYLTLAAYYLSLSGMRAWATGHESLQSVRRKRAAAALPQARESTMPQQVRKQKRESAAMPPQENEILRSEIKIYKTCSIHLILLTVVLSGMVILMVHAGGGKHYPGMIIYVAALYTFIKVPLAVRSWIRTLKKKTPTLMTIRSVSFADACVSVLSLQTAMFASFGGDGGFEMRMNAITGAAVCMLVLAIGGYGVYHAASMKRKME